MATKTVEAQLAELTARLERQEAELQALKAEGRVRRAAAVPEQRSSRRDLFKLAGGAVAGAAGASMLGTQAALAVDGSAVLAGQSNSETLTTTIDATGGSGDVTGLLVKGKGASPGVRGEAGATGPGVYGQGAGGASGPGVFGQTVGDGDGVSGLGTGTGSGVTAQGGANGGNGVHGVGGHPAVPSGAAGHGVVGTGVDSGGSGPDGIGVLGFGGPLAAGVAGNGSYGGQFNGALAPVLLMGHVNPGPPSANSHVTGEIYVDGVGAFWLCTADGTPGTWGRVGNVVQNFGAQANTGGVVNLLPNPIRILDTRTNTARNNNGQPVAGGATLNLAITGVSDLNGSSTVVPAGAVAVIGNVTAVFPQGDGDLRLFPHGVSLPTTSNLNYNLNVTIANAATVGLDGSGHMDIYADVSATHVLFDASGFVI